VGWDQIYVASVGGADATGVSGRSIEDLAATLGRTPFQAVTELMLAHEGQIGQFVGEISGRENSMDALGTILDHPAGAIVTDAEDYGRGLAHPAHAGAFLRALRMARERGSIPLETLVHRMSGYPASILGLAQTGLLVPGAVADLVVFDPASVTDKADWSEPRAEGVGVSRVMVGGRWVVADGRYRPGGRGRVLRGISRSPV
jgi:N-acyl-D-aspartate/D-glutamate deacylase